MSSTQDREEYITLRYRLWRDLAVNFDYKRRKAARIAEIIRQTGPVEPTAVELGVGPGGIAAEISRRGVHVIGVDLSPDALVRAREHCRSERVTLVRGSGFHLPFLTESIALLYAPQVLHLFDNPDRLALMTDVFRVLRPGARFVFDMKNVSTHLVRYVRSSADRRARNYPRRAEVLGLLRQSGFSAVRTLPGVLPGVGLTRIPDLGAFRLLSHTLFYIARK
jgi:ubiquinone/menaquinone biosynthesis C-methylase UbiE